jgi:hypothetical protein
MGCRADTARDYFDLLGRSLFHLFFEKAWNKVEPKISETAELVVVSDIPEVLQLPWELLSLKGKEAIGFYPGFIIRRLPKAADDLPAFSGNLPPGPLRALFMVCEPLDIELEERSIMQAMEGLDIAFEICDAGSFEKLLSIAESFRPHLIHLFGLGKMLEGRAHFSFQTVGGRPDLRSPVEMGFALAKIGVSCIILGGCQRETPQSLDLLCQGLISHIPLAVAWNASADSSRGFYSSLAPGTLDEALGQARAEARSCSDREQGKTCALPFLYSSTDQDRLFDPAIGLVATVQEWEEQLPLHGMTEGYAEDFVDRRRDLQRLASALREGTARAVVITGPEGIGKTALATRLALILASEGYPVIPVYSSKYNPISAARLLETAIGVLAGCGREEEAQRLRDPAVSPAERLKSMLDMLEQERVLILLDDLDMDEKTGKIKDAELSEFYLHMLRQMDRCRVIITGRALPADALTLPRKAWEWPLLGLSEAAFIKYLLKDDTSSPTGKGDGYEQLQALHGSLVPSGLVMHDAC